MYLVHKRLIFRAKHLRSNVTVDPPMTSYVFYYINTACSTFLLEATIPLERCGCGFWNDLFCYFQITWARQLLGVNTSYQILTIGDSTYIDDPRFLVDMSTVNYVSFFFTQLFLTALWRHSAYILLLHTFDISTLLLPATFTGLVYKDFASGTIWLWNLQMPGQHPSAPVHRNISQYCRYDKLYCNFIWVSLKKIAVLFCLFNALFPFYFHPVVVKSLRV